jgi:sugar-specific transcriptional regulator TrmB
MQEDVLLRNLNDIGLEFYEAKIFLLLVTNGVNSVWNIAKLTKLPRTTVYRYIENLLKKGFVVERLEGKGRRYEAIVKEKFDNIVLEKKQEYLNTQLQSSFLVKELTSLAVSGISNYKVLNYKGIEGLKQVTWNSTKATDTFRIFEIDLLTSVVDHDFAEKMRIEFAKMPIEFRQLTNKTFFGDYTRVTEHVQKWKVKHLPLELLDIKVEIQVYNDVTCMYDYSNEDVFIVEIYNQKLADMHKQMFDMYWSMALPMDIISPYGSARLSK